MSVQVEKLEKNMAKLTVEVPAEEVEKALQAAYMKEKNKISITASQKMGMETPMRDTTMLTLSTQVFCLTAARMPRGSASTMDTTAATSVSTTV